MATLYTINIADSLADMKNALNSHGLLGIVWNEQSGASSTIVFETPLLPGKVIKFSIRTGAYSTLSVGDSWTDKFNISNQIFLIKDVTNSSSGALMIVDNNFFFVALNRSDNPFAFIGLLDNGESVYSGYSNNANSAGPFSYALSSAAKIAPISTNIDFRDSAGNIYAMPLMWKNLSTEKVIQTGAFPAVTPGIKTTSCIVGTGPYILGPNYLLTRSASMGTNSGSSLGNSLLIEFS